MRSELSMMVEDIPSNLVHLQNRVVKTATQPTREYPRTDQKNEVLRAANIQD